MEFFDEMLSDKDVPRDSYAKYHSWFNDQNPKDLKRKMAEAEAVFRRTGITFNVLFTYSEITVELTTVQPFNPAAQGIIAS